MLGDFATYNPASWIEEGILREIPLPRARASAPVRKQPWSTTIAAGMALAFATVTGFVPDRSIGVISQPRQLAPDLSASHPGDPDVVGPRYWKNVSSYLKRLPGAVDRDDVPDPDVLV